MTTMAAKARFRTLYANTTNASSDPCLHRLVPSTPTSSSEGDDGSQDARPTSPSHSASSSQCSTVENATPERGSQADARKMAAGRQLPRRLWQPDREAEKCSILGCQKKFADWTILTSQRHHCRSCGRVVCHACSSGTRILLPPRGEKGQARAVRVCDACLTNQETYNFCASPKVGSQASSSFVSQNASVKNGSPPTGALEEEAGTDKEQGPCSVAKLTDLKGAKEDKPARPPMFRSNSAPSLVKLAEGDIDSEPNALTSAESEEAADEAQPPSPSKRNSGGTSVPVQVPNKRSSMRGAVAKDVMEGMGEVDERVRRVQTAFAESSYYHGLLRHEPAALRILILAEASQDPPQTSA